MGKANRKRSKGRAVVSATQMVDGVHLSGRLDGKHRRAEALKVQAATVAAEAKAVTAEAAALIKAGQIYEGRRLAQRALALRAEARLFRTTAAQLDVEVVAGHAEAIERGEVNAGVAERAGLESLRMGAPVEAVKMRGAEVKRLSGVDGLEAMKLAPDLKAAGMGYRDLFRAQAWAFRSPLEAIGMARGGGINRADIAAAASGKRQRALTEMHAKIARTEGMTAGHVAVLVAVAGEGQTMRQFAGDGARARSAAAKRLGEVLAVVHALLTPARGGIQVAYFGDS